VLPFWSLAIMQLSLFFSITCDVIELPLFIPNDFLYKTHADKGKDKWEIYAWAVREVMADASKLKKND